MKIKAIVFDKDGTLIDYAGCWLERTKAATKKLLLRHSAMEAYEPIMKRMGILDDGTVDISGALCHGTYRSITDDYAEELEKIGIKTDRERLFSELKSDFDSFKQLAESIPTAEGIKELLEKLKSEGIKLALITTDERDGAERTLAPLGIFDMFDSVLCSDGIHKGKPDPYFMNVFMSEYGLSPSEVLMVGDTRSDMLFGTNAGTYTLGIASSEKNREYLEPFAHYTAESVTKIPEILLSI